MEKILAFERRKEIDPWYTLAAAAADANVDPPTFASWLQNKDLIFSATSSSRSIHPGPSSQHPQMEEKLLEWIKKVRSGPNPLVVDRQVLIHKALKINPDATFANKTASALQSWVSNFLRRHSHVLTTRRITSTATTLEHHMKGEEVAKFREEFANTLRQFNIINGSGVSFFFFFLVFFFFFWCVCVCVCVEGGEVLFYH